MIKLIGEKLKQYDLDRIVQLAPRHGYKLETVRFWKADAEDPLTVAFREQDGMTVADIPNILLKKFGVLTVEAVSVDDCGIFYVEKSTINVSKRPMPEGYEYHETEVLELGKGGGMGGADWNAAEGESGHVLNRTHYAENGLVEILPEMSLTYDESMGNMSIQPEAPFEVDKTYIVTYNGTPYTCVCYEVEIEGVHMVGVGNGVGFGVTDTGEPFVMGNVPAMMPGMTVVMDYTGATTCTVSVSGESEVIHHLDPKYIKDMYSEKVEEISIDFDGNLDGKYIGFDFGLVGQKWVKVSYLMPTVEDLKGATFSLHDGTTGETTTWTVAEYAAERGVSVDELVVFDESTGIISCEFVAVATRAYSNADGRNFTPGTYFVHTDITEYGVTTLAWASNLTYTTTEIKKIDNKYIDAEWMATKTEELQELYPETTVTFTDYGTNHAGMALGFCTGFPIDFSTQAIGTKLAFYFNGTAYNTEVRVLDPNEATLQIYVGNAGIMDASFENTGEPFMVMVSGMVLDNAAFCYGAGDHAIKVDVLAVTYNKMPSEFIDMPTVFSGNVTGIVSGTVQTPNLYVCGGDTETDRYYRLTFKANQLKLININDSTDYYDITVTKGGS